MKIYNQTRKEKYLRVFFILFLFISLGNAKPLITDSQIATLAKQHGEMAKRRLRSWQALMQKNLGKSEKEKLVLVNDFFNRYQFRSDISFIGKSDYWQTPLEFVINGIGDCEDFSIAKYFTLIALNVSVDKLRITYVKSLTLNQAHMVVAYYESTDSEPLVLDNLKASILPSSKRRDLLPVYSFNGDSLWLNKQRGQLKHIGTAKHLSKWQTVLQRMRQGE